jgi:hypothetical protein
MSHTERKREIQKIILRNEIGPEEPFEASSGFKIKIVSFSLRFLPALKSTRKEKRRSRKGIMKSIKDINTL